MSILKHVDNILYDFAYQRPFFKTKYWYRKQANILYTALINARNELAEIEYQKTNPNVDEGD